MPKTDVERKSCKSMCSILLIQSRAVLVLERQPADGPPVPSWIQSYNSPHMAGKGFKKIPNPLSVSQVALASIGLPTYHYPLEIDNTQYQDISSVGDIDLCAAIYAEVFEGDYVRSPIAVSIGSENSAHSNAKGSKTHYLENPALAARASIGHYENEPPFLYEDPLCYYRFEISENVPEKCSRSIGKPIKPKIAKKLSTPNKYIVDLLRGFNSREPIEKSTDKSNRKASSTDLFFKGSARRQETLNYITKLTQAYLLRNDVQTRIFECAQTLVDYRRHRAQANSAQLKMVEIWPPKVGAGTKFIC